MVGLGLVLVYIRMNFVNRNIFSSVSAFSIDLYLVLITAEAEKPLFTQVEK